MRKLTVLLLLIFSLLLVSCGGEEESSSTDSGANSGTTSGDTTGDVARGEALYKGMTIGSSSAPGCITCHSLEEGVTLVGPSHAGMGTRAASAVPGQNAETYLHESIVDPNEHITDGFTSGVMYQNYGDDLTEQEVNDLVAYLLSLK